MARFEEDFEFNFDADAAADPRAQKHSFPSQAPREYSFKPIHKKVVCRYWLNRNCSKGDACEFLHEFNRERMPECRKGASCGDPSCILNHSSKEDKPPCPAYEAGFCSYGNSCTLRHDFKNGPPPVLATMMLANDPAKQWVASRARTQRTFRKAKCPYFQSDGWCPYFYWCAFAH